MANIGNVELEKSHKDLAIRQWFFDIDRDPGDGHVYTAPVGSFPANDWGLRDMHGNVWEWCHDTYGDTAYDQYRSPGNPRPHQTAVDPVNEEPWNEFGDWRVIRGGSWYTAPVLCRSDIRGYFDAADAFCYLGFRVVRDAPHAMAEAAKDDWEKEQAAIAILKRQIGDFQQRDMLERVAQFRDNPGEEATRDMHRISALTAIVANGGDASFIQNVSKVNGLKSPQLYNARGLTDDDLAPLAKLKSLEELLLAGPSQLTNACIEHLTGLTNLKRLQLSGSAITDEGLSQLQHLKQLEELELQQTGAAGTILTSFRGVPLKHLILRDLSDEHAAQLGGFQELERFQCNGQSLTDRGFAHFAGLKRLKSLNLAGCRGISSSGFGALRSLTNLTSLDISHTNAGDDALRQLVRHDALNMLSIGSDRLTDAGMQYLCEIISLQVLTINNNAKVTDEGLKDLWRLQRLGILNLNVDGLTGKGFDTLAEARKTFTL